MAKLVDDFHKGDFAETARRYRNIRKAVRNVKLKTALGKGHQTDKRNVSKFAEKNRNAQLDDINRDEAMIGETGDILTSETLEIGILARRMVVKIEKRNGVSATGFFVGQDLLMTNKHVIADAAEATKSKVICGDQDTFYPPNPIYFSGFAFDPGAFFWKDDALDVAVIAVSRKGAPKLEPEDIAVADFGYMPLIKDQGKAVHGDPLNIFHYPGSRRQRVTLHNGNLAYLADDTELDPYFWHTCDTQRGSSGAPVLNRHWQVVGLHSRGVPDTNSNGELLDKDGKPISADRLAKTPAVVHWVANQGTRASRIVSAMEKAALSSSMGEIRDRLLALWAEPESWEKGFDRTNKANAKLRQL